MSTEAVSSYEPFRERDPDGTAYQEDTERLIARGSHNGGSEYSPRGKVQRKRQTTQRVRISFRVVALILAMTILGVQAYSIYTWLSTRGQYFYNPATRINTRAWAIIDGRPAWIMMAAAVVATVIQLSALTSHLCVCLIKRHDSRQHTVGVFISSAILILFWIAAMIYFKLAITKDKSKAMWDIWTWSCHERAVKGEIPWNILCILQGYTWIASIVVVVIEITVFLLFIYSARSRSRTARKTYREVGK
ncbi:hypothetical protein IQ07DRAFT_650622 [Pyrenochaeta sp. DS3sAY3a]|nr:hypothetical protein IQ07DRAFT_650622 [Pyrenochaeta sp. DS3sAY3a]